MVCGRKLLGGRTAVTVNGLYGRVGYCEWVMG